VVATLEDARLSAVVTVASLEETPVNETLELRERLIDQLGRPPVAVVANSVIRDRLGTAAIAQLDGSLPAPVERALRSRHERVRLHAAQLRRLRRGETPVIALPQLAGALGPSEIAELSSRLTRAFG
jgi:hypothetical protein